MNCLVAKHIGFKYDGKAALVDLSFEVKQGEHITIIGANGSGKTTLLKIIAGLKPFSGEITLMGRPLLEYSAKQRAEKLALFSQSTTAYFPLSIYDTVKLARFPYHKNKLKDLNQNDHKIVMDAIRRVGHEGYQDRLITELSGGELQRVYLARALAQDPKILLLDEPTNHLDLKYQLELFNILKDWVKDANKTVISVLHDINLVNKYADKVMMLKKGHIIAMGSCQTILNRENLKRCFDVDYLTLKNLFGK